MQIYKSDAEAKFDLYKENGYNSVFLYFSFQHGQSWFGTKDPNINDISGEFTNAVAGETAAVLIVLDLKKTFEEQWGSRPVDIRIQDLIQKPLIPYELELIDFVRQINDSKVTAIHSGTDANLNLKNSQSL